MPEYRIYTLGFDGHAVNAEDIECADDREAIKKAQQTVNGRDAELWELGRFMGRLMPGDILFTSLELQRTAFRAAVRCVVAEQPESSEQVDE
jgi:hypothetical protein